MSPIQASSPWLIAGLSELTFFALVGGLILLIALIWYVARRSRSSSPGSQSASATRDAPRGASATLPNARPAQRSDPIAVTGPTPASTPALDPTSINDPTRPTGPVRIEVPASAPTSADSPTESHASDRPDPRPAEREWVTEYEARGGTLFERSSHERVFSFTWQRFDTSSTPAGSGGSEASLKGAAEASGPQPARAADDSPTQVMPVVGGRRRAEQPAASEVAVSPRSPGGRRRATDPPPSS